MRDTIVIDKRNLSTDLREAVRAAAAPPQRVTIRNYTKWNTAHLRRFINEVARRQGRPKTVAFDFVGTTIIDITRSALSSVGTNHIVLYLPSGRHRDNIKQQLALNVAIALAQMKGTHSSDNPWTTYRPDWAERYQWATELPLERRKPPTKRRLTGADLVVKQIVAVTKSIAAWERKRKRAENAIHKYETKLRYYQRRVKTLTKEQTK